MYVLQEELFFSILRQVKALAHRLCIVRCVTYRLTHLGKLTAHVRIVSPQAIICCHLINKVAIKLQLISHGMPTQTARTMIHTAYGGSDLHASTGTQVSAAVH